MALFLSFVNSFRFILCDEQCKRIFCPSIKRATNRKILEEKKAKRKYIRNRVLQAKGFAFLVNLCTTRALHTIFFSSRDKG